MFSDSVVQALRDRLAPFGSFPRGVLRILLVFVGLCCRLDTLFIWKEFVSNLVLISSKC